MPAAAVQRGVAKGAVLAPVLAPSPLRTQGEPQPILQRNQEMPVRDDRSFQVSPHDGRLEVAAGTRAAGRPEVPLVVTR